MSLHSWMSLKKNKLSQILNVMTSIETIIEVVGRYLKSDNTNIKLDYDAILQFLNRMEAEGYEHNLLYSLPIKWKCNGNEQEDTIDCAIATRYAYLLTKNKLPFKEYCPVKNYRLVGDYKKALYADKYDECATVFNEADISQKVCMLCWMMYKAQKEAKLMNKLSKDADAVSENADFLSQKIELGVPEAHFEPLSVEENERATRALCNRIGIDYDEMHAEYGRKAFTWTCNGISIYE